MKFLFTGGGSAGHVTPNVALIERLLIEGHEVVYVGSSQGIERDIIKRLDVVYRSIATGKLRRYFSWQNFIDPFFIFFGLLQAVFICLGEKPALVFSKGGFVSVPVVIAAWCCRIPVISHESDVTPGLATRLCQPFSRWVCANFEESSRYLDPKRLKVTGTPVRDALLTGDAARGRQFLNLPVDDNTPVLLVFGGSLGAQRINQAIRTKLDELLNRFTVVHICGAGNLAAELEPKLVPQDGQGGYHQFEYVYEEFGDLLALSSVVVSRAGANSIYELLLTRTPHLLIPLGLEASRGDQIINARTFQQSNLSEVLYESDLGSDQLVAAIDRVYQDRVNIRARLQKYSKQDSVETIIGLIKQTARADR